MYPRPAVILDALAPFEGGARVNLSPSFEVRAVRDALSVHISAPLSAALDLPAGAVSLDELIRAFRAPAPTPSPVVAVLGLVLRDELPPPLRFVGRLAALGADPRAASHPLAHLTHRGAPGLASSCGVDACGALVAPSAGVVARVAPCGCSAVYGDLLAPHATVRAEPGGSWAVVEAEPAAAPLRAPADLFAALLCAVALVAWEAPHDEPR
jgi:hypothetical protein